MSNTTARDRRIWPGQANPTDNPAPTDLVRLGQAAELRPWATTRYLRRLVAEGRINSWRVGRLRLVSLAELDALAARGHTPGGAA